MITRRTFLGGLAVAAAGVPLAANSVLAQGGAGARAAMSLTLANESGRGPVWTYVVGTNLATGQQCRLSADGQLLAVSEADNGPDGYTDYAIPVEGGGTTLSLPQGMSGRIYLAIGEKLKFRCNPGNALAYPAGWVGSDPNYPILHDCAEFTYDGAGMHCNTTMVDMLSVPLAITRRSSSTSPPNPACPASAANTAARPPSRSRPVVCCRAPFRVIASGTDSMSTMVVLQCIPAPS